MPSDTQLNECDCKPLLDLPCFDMYTSEFVFNYKAGSGCKQFMDLIIQNLDEEIAKEALMFSKAVSLEK